MKPGLAMQRILACECQRKQVRFRIEKEYLDIIEGEGLEHSDFANIALQRLVMRDGLPVLLVCMRPEGRASVRPLDRSDVVNLALDDLFRERGLVQ